MHHQTNIVINNIVKNKIKQIYKIIMGKTIIKPKIIRKTSPTDTLRAIEVGGEVLIKTRVIKQSIISATITRLNRTGYQFKSTSKGLIDEVKVTRLK